MNRVIVEWDIIDFDYGLNSNDSIGFKFVFKLEGKKYADIVTIPTIEIVKKYMQALVDRDSKIIELEQKLEAYQANETYNESLEL